MGVFGNIVRFIAGDDHYYKAISVELDNASSRIKIQWRNGEQFHFYDTHQVRVYAESGNKYYKPLGKNRTNRLVGAAAITTTLLAGGAATAGYFFGIKPQQDKKLTDTGNQRYEAGKKEKSDELQPQLDQLKKDKQTQDSTISDLTRRLNDLQNRVGGNTPAALRTTP